LGRVASDESCGISGCLQRDDWLIEESNIEEFFQQLVSTSNAIAKAWSVQHPSILRAAYLEQGFRAVNYIARNRLYLAMEEAVFEQFPLSVGEKGYVSGQNIHEGKYVPE
jgi:hypothetical protein